MAVKIKKIKKRKGRRSGIVAAVGAFLILAAIVLTVRFHVLDGLFSGCSSAAGLPDVLPELPKNGELSVYTLDVGQGSCALLISPNGRTMLIDSGDAEHGAGTVEMIHALGVETLDIVIGTHPHGDHIGAMPRILREFAIGEYVMPNVPIDCLAQPSVDSLLVSEQIPVKTAWSGDMLIWDRDCTVTILAPVPGCEYSDTDANDRSLIIRVEYKSTAFIFTGDATVHSEQLAMFHNEKSLFKADVLTVSHHGSTTASSVGFLETVNAKYAIISVGRDNPYGHPDFSILNRLDYTGYNTIRTDENGWIAAISDGKEVRITTQKDSK